MNSLDVERPILRLVDLVHSLYVFPDIAEHICHHIHTRLESGIYASARSSTELAQTLTSDLQSVNQDKHLEVEVNPDLVETINSSQGSERPQDEPETEDCGFEIVDCLDGSIGYLKLTEFADTKYAGDIAVAAMQRLAGSKGLIIDLRQNGGGSPKMIQLITTYLFEHEPVHLNDFYMRSTDSLDQFWTLPYVPGKRLSNAFVYILTSGQTFSAAEEFCYNLQNLKRATVIGEVTGGGAHPGDDHSLNDELCVFIPHGRAINPVSGTNWEGFGIQPDIEISSNDAFDVAYRMAQAQ